MKPHLILPIIIMIAKTTSFLNKPSRDGICYKAKDQAAYPLVLGIYTRIVCREQEGYQLHVKDFTPFWLSFSVDEVISHPPNNNYDRKDRSGPNETLEMGYTTRKRIRQLIPWYKVFKQDLSSKSQKGINST